MEEDILEKYYEDAPEDDENKDGTQTFGLGISHINEFEFLNAFELIAGEGVDAISKDKIQDIFRAVGYSLRDWDINLYDRYHYFLSRYCNRTHFLFI
jgi:hypothetical protein